MRILCVDDDRLVLAVTADLLRDLGHEVFEAANATDAGTAFRHGDIDLLVTDMNMPDGSGQDLAANLRRERSDLPVIYFSGMAHTLAPGIDGVILRKPCTLGELQLAVDRVMVAQARGV